MRYKIKNLINAMRCVLCVARNKGMTYVELIIVLSIFSVMSSIVLFNYGKFQAKVDIKNLANDIALKIVQAQKDAMSGKLQTGQFTTQSWKPSYGVYFNSSDNASFIYFVDLDQNGNYETSSLCPNDNECIDKINITKGNYINRLSIFYQNETSQNINDITLTFTRPSSAVTFTTQTLASDPGSEVSYYQISISSSDNSTISNIKVYPSGRIQVN